MLVTKLEITNQITSDHKEEVKEFIKENLGKFQGITIECITDGDSFPDCVSSIRQVLTVLDELIDTTNIKCAMVFNENFDDTTHFKSFVKLYDDIPVCNENIFV